MKIKNALKYLPAFIFCAFIFTFMILLFVIPKQKYSAQEKKMLADFPSVTVENIMDGKFQEGLDTWLSDHLPARNFFVGLSADYELVTGRNGKKGIYLGKEGYLFPKPTADTEKISENAGYIKEFADCSDVPVYMSLIPSSGYVNSDKLPLNHEPYNDGELIDKFSSQLGENITFTDVKSEFSEKAKTEQLYYRTDHHWTAKGAYECYRLLGEKLGYEPVPEENFEKERIDGFYGTSYSKSALWWVSPDKIELWKNKDQSSGSVSVSIHDGDEEKDGNSYFFREHLNEDDKYPVYLDGNHSLVRIKNSDAKGGKLIIVKDSYAHAIAPFLSQNYSEIIMVDLRYYKKDVSALAQQEKADGVLILYSLDNLAADDNISFLF